MLLDLGRNDVGRVAEIGSVKVTESFAIERFSHVMHISSNVEGSLHEGLDALDALVAGFPAGTLSGAPKVRAMGIIEELEPDRRSIYAGCIGYFAANGTMDTCIGLRTALVKDGVMYVQAGAGIVADSEAEFEHEECHQKARALLRAASTRRCGSRPGSLERTTLVEATRRSLLLLRMRPRRSQALREARRCGERSGPAAQLSRGLRPRRGHATLAMLGGCLSDDPAHRQLRLIHLQPVPLPG